MFTEAGHWYDRDGKACHTYENDKGETKSTTLRQARPKQLLPSVSGIIKMANKEGLNHWIMRENLKAAMTMQPIKNESVDAYLRRVKEAGRAVTQEAADIGTAIHAALEHGFNGQSDFLSKVETHYFNNVLATLAASFPGEKWESEVTFASELGYGGSVDLHSKEWVIDFKTKAKLTPETKDRELVNNDNIMQLQAYGHGLKLEQFSTANLYISTHPSHRGLCRLIIHDQEAEVKGWGMYKCLLRYWQYEKNYDSRYELC